MNTTTIHTQDGRLVTLPTVDMLWIYQWVEKSDSILFWHERADGSWQPFLMPRHLYEDRASLDPN